MMTRAMASRGRSVRSCRRFWKRSTVSSACCHRFFFQIAITLSRSASSLISAAIIRRNCGAAVRAAPVRSFSTRRCQSANDSESAANSLPVSVSSRGMLAAQRLGAQASRDHGIVGTIPEPEELMRKVRVAPKGMGINDFVAEEEGFFAAEGIEVEWDIKTFRGTQSSWKGSDYFQRPQDKPYTQGDKSVIQCACVWGSISNASAGMGRFVPDCYGLSPWAIFVRPDSKIRRPEDLKDVPVSVGMRAGSHFNVPFRLEKYLPLEHIKTVNTGGFGARLKALLDGEVEAASLLPPQIDM